MIRHMKCPYCKNDKFIRTQKDVVYIELKQRWQPVRVKEKGSMKIGKCIVEEYPSNSYECTECGTVISSFTNIR